MGNSLTALMRPKKPPPLAATSERSAPPKMKPLAARVLRTGCPLLGKRNGARNQRTRPLVEPKISAVAGCSGKKGGTGFDRWQTNARGHRKTVVILRPIACGDPGHVARGGSGLKF